MEDYEGALLVAQYGRHVVGLCKLSRQGPGEWWLQGVRVHPEYEGRGIASHLHARVDIRREDGALLIDVVDDGLGTAAASDPSRTGRGLIGMRERAAVLGGELQAGPRPEGGFAVHARIPLEGRA